MLVPPFAFPAHDLLLWTLIKGLIHNIRGSPASSSRQDAPRSTQPILLLSAPSALFACTARAFALRSGLALPRLVPDTPANTRSPFSRAHFPKKGNPNLFFSFCESITQVSCSCHLFQPPQSAPSSPGLSIRYAANLWPQSHPHATEEDRDAEQHSAAGCPPAVSLTARSAGLACPARDHEPLQNLSHLGCTTRGPPGCRSHLGCPDTAQLPPDAIRCLQSMQNEGKSQFATFLQSHPIPTPLPTPAPCWLPGWTGLRFTLTRTFASPVTNPSGKAEATLRAAPAGLCSPDRSFRW